MKGVIICGPRGVGGSEVGAPKICPPGKGWVSFPSAWFRAGPGFQPLRLGVDSGFILADGSQRPGNVAGTLDRQGLGGEEREEPPGPGPWMFAVPQACCLVIGVQTTSRVTRWGETKSALPPPPGVTWLVGWCPFIGGQQEHDQNKRKGQPRGWLGWW